jgi:hypothetical protein
MFLNDIDFLHQLPNLQDFCSPAGIEDGEWLMNLTTSAL